MKNLINNIKKAGIGLGLLALAYVPLKAQENPLRVKAGLVYNIVQTDEISKNCLGIETLIEKKFKERLFGEFEIGLYADTRTTSSVVYSKMQTNFGIRYRPILKKGWSVGGKAALGVSSEFYKPIESADNSETIHFNKIVGIDLQKTFRNNSGVNLSVSREIDRNSWIVGAKYLFKPRSRNDYNQTSYPWSDF